MISSFLQKYIENKKGKKNDLFSIKMNELKTLAEKNNDLLNVVMIDNEVVMIYELINDIKSFAIERFCYDDFYVINQFDGFIEQLYYLDNDFDVIHHLFAEKYKNYLLFNLEDSVYGTFGHKSLSSYKPLKMKFKSFFNDNYDRFVGDYQYLQSIHSDITNEILYNNFIDSFIKDFDSYSARVYDLTNNLEKNGFSLLFGKELPIVDKSNTCKTFGFNLFWKNEDLMIPPGTLETKYIVLVGTKDYEEKPLTVLRFSKVKLEEDIYGLMVDYVETNQIYYESNEYYKELVLERLNEYMNSFEEELFVLNLNNHQQFIIRESIHKHIKIPYVLDLKFKDEFLKRIKIID